MPALERAPPSCKLIILESSFSTCHPEAKPEGSIISRFKKRTLRHEPRGSFVMRRTGKIRNGERMLNSLPKYRPPHNLPIHLAGSRRKDSNRP